MQTKPPDKLVIFDDNDNPIDVRELPLYQHLFNMLNERSISWEWIYAGRKGQHYNHQMANKMGFKWVWRLDDDTTAEHNVLEKLYSTAISNDQIGAVGGSVLTAPTISTSNSTGKILNIDLEPNLQWGNITKQCTVEHLHCSFLYRANIADYDLRLSRIAHREETMFTYSMIKKGYVLLLVPCVTWHLKNPYGGIRNGTEDLFKHDEALFQFWLKDQTPVVLNNGMGDHIVFKHVLPFIKNPIVYSCYPDIVPGKSIAEAINTFGNIDNFNIYSYMDSIGWKDSLESAFRRLYCANI
jgi:hypothetical protein